MSTTLIAKRTRVGGRIETEGDVLVEGRVEGTLVAEGCVTVGVTGVAVSDIQAGRAIILGIVIGNITASDRLDVAASARVVGDVRAAIIALAGPGVVEGRVEEIGPQGRPPPSRPVPVVQPQPAQTQRPTLRIRGGPVVRPARPEPAAPPEPGGTRSTADLGAAPRLRTRDPNVIPLPPRPPLRARMNPRRAPGE